MIVTALFQRSAVAMIVTALFQRSAAAMVAVALFIGASSAPLLAADSAGVEQKAALCAACHGPNGNSTNPVMPSLAAQPGQFITTQLIMFREGRRKDPLMSPIAAPLTNPEINALGKYFAAQTLTPPQRQLDSATATEGRELTHKYNCTACHGPELKGQQHIPRLAGQQAEYLRTQLRGFKAGTRFDMDGNMTAAAQPLTEKDIDLLTNYLSALK
jgi:cytochrome c553